MKRLLAASVAGCCVALATGAPAAGRESRSFSAPVVVDRSAANSTGEPSIDVAHDGTTYIVAPDSFGVRAPSTLGGSGVGGSLLWRSTDSGAHWKFLGSYDVPTGGGDTDVVTSPDGTVYGSGLSYVACSTVARSTDKGQTFVPVPVAGCGQIPLSNDREWNAVDGNNTLFTVIGDTMNGQIDLIRSAVVNPAVIPSVTMPLSTNADYEWPGTVAVDPRNGRTYTVWNSRGAPDDCDDNPCRAPASSIQPDLIEVSVLPRGSTTPPPPVVFASRDFDTFDSFVSNAVDAAGRVYVVWSERHPAAGQTWTMLSSSGDGGHRWSTPVKVNASPKTTTFPWVTVGSSGRIAVSYYGTAARGNSPQRVDNDAHWQVYSAFSTNAGRTFTEYRTTRDMYTGRICTSGTGCASGGRDLGDFFETAMDPTGCLVTAFTDRSSGTPYIAFVRQTGGPGLLGARACGPQPARPPA